MWKGYVLDVRQRIRLNLDELFPYLMIGPTQRADGSDGQAGEWATGSGAPTGWVPVPEVGARPQPLPQ